MKKIKYVIGILLSFVFTCMFAFNIVLNIMHRNITFAFLSLISALCSFMLFIKGIIEIYKYIKEKNK